MNKTQILRAFALWLASSAAFAQEPPTPPRPPAAVSPQQRAFEATPEADRKAVQEALGWLGFYNGVDDGGFGKRTVDALKAYQGAGDGVLTPKLVAALKDAMVKAKAAVGFRMVVDASTGMRIGAPVKLLDKRSPLLDSAGEVGKEGPVRLALWQTKGDLAGLFKTVSADYGARKVTYKYLKTGAFFVVAGEEGDAKFYRRYAAQGDTLRGFAFVYPKARAKALDPVALAIANSFDPFPAAPLPPASPTPSPTPTPETPKLAATALIVGPGVAVTTLDPAACKVPTVAGKPARFLEPQGPLARLGGDFGAGAVAPPLGGGGGEMVALSLTAAGGRASLVATPAQPLGAGKALAALGPGGAPLFDRQGRLVAFAAAGGATPRRAGVPLAAPHATVSVGALGQAAPAAAAADLTAAEIAKLRRAAVVGVFCAS